MNIPFKQYWRLLVNYLKPQSGRVALLAVLVVGGIALQLINPQIIRYFLDTAEAGGSQNALLAAAGLFLVFAVGQQVVAAAASYVGEGVGWTATNNLRADLALHCLRLDMSFHKTHTPGELIERIDGDVSALAGFFSQLVVLLIGNLLLIVGVLILLFVEDWRLGLGMALYAVLVLAVLQSVHGKAVGLWEAVRKTSAALFSFLEERLAGTEDIRANGGEAYVMRRLYELMRAVMQSEARARILANVTFFITHFLYVTSYSLGLAIGVYLFTQGLATIGTVYLIVYYVGRMEAPLTEIRYHIEELQAAAASIGRVDELFRIQPKVREPEESGDFPQMTQISADRKVAVAFDGVSFGYDDYGTNGNGQGPLAALQDISFQLAPGRVLGLLGRTGSGKTTLTRLLFRLYDPTAGAIRLNGVDIRRLSLAAVRDAVGMVTQDVQLFQATVRDNITFFDRHIPDEKIVAVLDELGLRRWLASLPSGLDTRLGAGGAGLSAGEAQLLAFARVFLKNPGLVILDEASSRLDPATEQLLERAIDRLLQGRAAIIIAHRLGTVQRADEVMILDGGQVVELGARVSLAADPGSRFYRLLQTGMAEELA